MEGWVGLRGWMVLHKDCLPVCRESPVQALVLTKQSFKVYQAKFQVECWVPATLNWTLSPKLTLTLYNNSKHNPGSGRKELGEMLVKKHWVEFQLSSTGESTLSYHQGLKIKDECYSTWSQGRGNRGVSRVKWPPRNLPGGSNMVFWPPRKYFLVHTHTFLRLHHNYYYIIFWN